MAVIIIDNELKEDEIIWRFLTLDKFCSILQTESLFYTSLSKFEDGHEGNLHPKNFKRKNLSKIDVKLSHSIVRKLSYNARIKQKQVGANCWCLSEYEPEFFWKIYSSLDSGIAIKTTVKKLKTSHMVAEKQIAIFKIKYEERKIKDQESFDKAISEHSMLLATNKRPHFSHEREIRCMIFLTPSYRGEYLGENVKINLKELIGEVICSPKSPKWFVDIVKNLLIKYDLSEIKCQKSSFEY